MEFKKYCPKCGWTGHFIHEPPGSEEKMPDLPDGDLTNYFPHWPWEHINIEHINILGHYNVFVHIICKKCRWDGHCNDLLSDNEIKNIKRTELIDKILK